MKSGETVEPLALLVYTRFFATLLGAGVSLVRILDILVENSEAPLQHATAQMHEEILNGSTLSAEMRERPDLFTPMYVAMVRAGEVGGVLDETLLQAADALEADFKDWQATGGEFHSLLFPSPPERSFAESSQADKLRMLSVYFRSFSTMLASGVPLGMALDTAAEALTAGPERDALAGIGPRLRQDCSPSDLMQRRVPFVPGFAVQLVRIGEETDTLDRMCEKVAQLLDYQRRHHLLKHGG